MRTINDYSERKDGIITFAEGEVNAHEGIPLWPNCIGYEAGCRTDTDRVVLAVHQTLVEETNVVKRAGNIIV